MLTETWHKSLICCHYVIDGYKLFFSSIKRNQNDDIFNFLKLNLDLEFFDYDFVETNIVKLLLKNLLKPIDIISVHRSPSPDISNFVITLSKVLEELKCKDVRTIFVGEMNLNIIGVNVNCNEYVDLFSGNGYESLINIYTKLPVGFRRSCLDYIFINYNDLSMSIINAGVLQIDIIDHFSTCVSIPVNTNYKFKKYNIMILINYDKMNSLLSQRK